MFKEPKKDENVIDFLRGMVQKPGEPKEDQWLRDNYPGLKTQEILKVLE